jgi:hypothetical protein
MQLDYLDFDFSDEDSGRGGFDAMATVRAPRVPAVLREMAAVLAWASRLFGPPSAGADDDVCEWDFELHALDEDGAPIDIRWDAAHGEVSIAPPLAEDALTTLTFTLSGSPALCDAFRREFVQHG